MTGSGLAQYLNGLVDYNPDVNISIVDDNHRAHRRLPPTFVLSQASFSTNIDEENDDVDPELKKGLSRVLNCVDTALGILSVNPPRLQHHDAKPKRTEYTSSSSLRLSCHSSSAPILRTRHARFKTTARWDEGSACSGGLLNHHGPSSQDFRNMGSGGGTSKNPIRSKKLVVGPSISNQCFKNARWDKHSSRPLQQGPNNNRLRNLGLVDFNAKDNHESKEKCRALRSSVVPDTSRTCRWTSIPKHSSDSNLVYPKRHWET